MKTIKQHLSHKTAFLKYVMLSMFIYLATCGQEAGCGGGVGPYIPPPDPVFEISYIHTNEDNIKVYFTPDQTVVIHSVAVREELSGFSVNTEYSYPFVLCNNMQQHFLDQYLIPVKGRPWTFSFTGVSKSTGQQFSVSTTKTIQ